MCLEEDDEPFEMPNLLEYCSSEKNSLSLIGRNLNPRNQKIASLILDFPRKWQNIGRVRGVVLTQEKFQFIFNSKHDLDEIYEKGVHTYNEWALVMEKWVESPENYLQFILVWVQIRHLPVNHYTIPAITALGELIRQILEVVFDLKKAQTKNYVRFKIRLDVSKLLRKFKIVKLPNGEQTEVSFNYEQIQKRCFHCQRLIHEKDFCPLLISQRKERALQFRQNHQAEVISKKLVLLPEDPLYRILYENQVGFMKDFGHLKIATDVMDEMMTYILAVDDSYKKIRISRVKKLIKDPTAQKTILRLEPAPLVYANVDKGKGRLFEYEEGADTTRGAMAHSAPPKLMAEAFLAGSNLMPSEERLSPISVFSEIKDVRDNFLPTA